MLGWLLSIDKCLGSPFLHSYILRKKLVQCSNWTSVFVWNPSFGLAKICFSFAWMIVKAIYSEWLKSAPTQKHPVLYVLWKYLNIYFKLFEKNLLIEVFESDSVCEHYWLEKASIKTPIVYAALWTPPHFCAFVKQVFFPIDQSFHRLFR